MDGVVIGLVLVGVITWVLQTEGSWAGIMLVVAGVARLLRWKGWLTWPEPLGRILHVGYLWVGLYLLALGTAVLGIGFSTGNAIHLLTTGAMGAMTLAVITRATLGHTGRPRHVDRLTVVMYVLINVGAILRVFASNPDVSMTFTHAMLGLSALCWSGAYLLFAFVYGPFLVRPSQDE